jgi:hypothetical protein
MNIMMSKCRHSEQTTQMAELSGRDPKTTVSIFLPELSMRLSTIGRHPDGRLS